MTHDKTISASLEDYLEAICQIVTEKQAVRAKDIACRLGVKGSSVSGALRALALRKLVNHAPYDVITLTPSGKRVAKEIIKRHEALKDFFVTVLRVDETEAEDVACRMEHAISKPLTRRFVQFVEFVKSCPGAGQDWLRMFDRFREDEMSAEDCAECAFLRSGDGAGSTCRSCRESLRMDGST